MFGSQAFSCRLARGGVESDWKRNGEEKIPVKLKYISLILTVIFGRVQLPSQEVNVY